MALLLVVSFESTPVLVETSASEELPQIPPGTSASRKIRAGDKDVFGVNASAGSLIRFSIEKGDLALATDVYGPTGDQKVQHVSEEFEIVELSVPADVSGRYILEIQSREKGNTTRE
jgi:hypothetical protein